MNRLSNILSPSRVMADRDSSHTGALSEQGSAPSFRATVRSATPVARILTAVVLMVLVLLIGKWAGSPMTDYYNGIQITK